jgi:nucleoside-diphosphate-sugar epimerase
MRVLVTGGAGRVGRWVVRELLARGHEVTTASRSAGIALPGSVHVLLDITDFPAVLRATRAVDAVVHLGGLAGPVEGGDQEVFDINARGTFHLYEACARNGIRRVAVASSINALGQRFGLRRIPVHYFPIDEDHPGLATDAYSFSKQVTEAIARYAWDRSRIPSVQLRLPGVVEPVPAYVDAFRAARQGGSLDESAPDFWCLLDCRDSARAFALGIETEYEGSHPLFVNDKVNCLGLPARDLVARCYPEVSDFRAPLEGDTALVTCARARALLGWEPEFSWKGVAAGGPVPTAPGRGG